MMESMETELQSGKLFIIIIIYTDRSAFRFI